MHAAEACEPTEGLTSLNTNDLETYCYAVLRVKLQPILVSCSAMEPHRLHPELGVKRCSGEDTLGVAPRENSSMPGQYSQKASFPILTGEQEAFVAFMKQI
jgi:hypothetical protein